MAIATELNINTSASALEMANAIFGDGITVVSATYSGDPAASGTYTGALTTIPGVVPTDSGVILSTGNVANFTNSSGTTNTNVGAGTGVDLASGVDGDAQLNAVSGQATFDGAILTADFIPTGDMLTMQFVFTSEEYPEYVNGGVNDSFGVWINGQFVEATISVAGNVSIDSVNGGRNQNLYRDNTADQFNTEMDGITYVLSFKAPVNQGQVNTIKIGIADGGDAVYDSNLLIMGNSVQTYALAMDDTIQLTANSSRTFDILANDRDMTDGGLTITHINGTAVVAGQTVTLSTGEQVRLNAGGTVTVFSDGDLGTNTLNYTIVDSAGNTDVGFIFIETVSFTQPDGIVQGTSGADTIQVGYLGDPDGDRIDNNDGQGVGGTTGNADYIMAGAGNDSIVANLGNDVIYAGTGDDTAFGGAGDDWVSLGEGNDSFGTYNADSEGNDTIYGEAGNDHIIGGGQNDILHGGDGNDSLSGGVGSDTMYGGDDADIFMVTDDHQGDTIFGGEGGNDNDLIAFGNFISPVGVNVTATGNEAGTYQYQGAASGTTGVYSQIEGISGTIHGDVINLAADGSGVLAVGNGGNDTIDGGAGDDSLYGDLGNDVINGGAGNDLVYGGDGDDHLNGDVSGNGNDTLYGGSGNDNILAGGGDNILIGDGGNDTLNAGASSGSNTLSGGTGDDQFVGGTGNDYVEGDVGNDTLIGGAGEDDMYGGADADLFYGGAGDLVVGGETGTDNDTLVLNYADVQSIAYGGGNNEAGTVTFTAASGGGTLSFSEIETIAYAGVVDGTAGDDTMGVGHTDAQGDIIDGADGLDDTILGYGGNDSITAGTGADLVYGGVGNDTIYGGIPGDAAADTVYGDAGNDMLIGAGGDALYGGAGNDIFNVYASAGAAGTTTIVGGEEAGDRDVLEIRFNDGLVTSAPITVTYTGDEAGTAVRGDSTAEFSQIEVVGTGSGNDLIDATANGADGSEYYSGAGDDTIYGGSGAEALVGDSGNDLMEAGEGRDSLYGGLGNDTLLGEAGNDQIDGGLGNDSLYGGDGNDTITTGGGNDLAYGGADNDSITGSASGTHTLHGDAGEDTIIAGGGGGLVYGGTGNDSLTGGSGLDQLMGNDGNDTISGGAGADALDGGADADLIYGTAGDTVVGGETFTTGTDNDTLVLNYADVESIAYGGGNNEAGTVTFTAASGGGTLAFWQIENITFTGPVDGTAAGELMGAGYTDINGDQVDGTDGVNDTIFGNGGDDTINAGSGNDLAYGGTGNDVMRAQTGNDTLYGDAGNDDLQSGSGDDLMYGGDGADLIHVNAITGADTVVGGEGNDAGFGDILNVDVGTVDAVVTFTGNEAGNVVAGSTTVTFSEIETVWTDEGNDTINASAATSNTNIWSGGGDDFITGGAGNDYVAAGFGNDDIFMGDGNDTVFADGGNDQVYGGDGNDQLYGVAGNDYMQGDAGNDLVDGGTGDDFARGDAGNDTVVGGAGNDSVYGGADDDIVYGGDGNDQVYGGFGTDTVYGGIGDDSVTGSGGDDVVHGDEGNDFVQGSDGNDTLYGGDGADTLLGEEDADVIHGGVGDYVDGYETVTTGTDNDTLHVSNVDYIDWDTLNPENGTVHFNGGGTLAFYNIENVFVDGVQVYPPNFIVEGTAGDDLIDGGYAGDPEGDMIDASDNFAGNNDDLVYAGSGNDTVLAGDGNDTVEGGSGDDSLDGGVANDSLTGGDGNDTLLGGAGDDSLTGWTGEDLFYGGEGNDLINTWGGTGDTGADTVYAGAGNDEVYGGPGDELVFLEDGDDRFGTYGTDSEGNDSVYGGAGNDEIIGGYGNDTLSGDAGNDTIGGGLGEDLIYGGDNDDLIYGEDGNDTLFGGLGNDSLDGGVGNDTLDAGDGDDTAVAGTGNDVIYGYAGNDSLFGEAGDDTLYGGSGDDMMDGEDGNDVFEGWLGNDTLVGDAGSDTMDGGEGDDQLYGGLNDDHLLAGDGNDQLYGGSGRDTLWAGEGNDTLYGEGGNDDMIGEGGDDRFVLTDGFGDDTIAGSESGETLGDTLDLSALTGAVTVDLTSWDPEAGLVTVGTDNSATFSQIENIVLGGATETIVLADGSGEDAVQGFAIPVDLGGGNWSGVDQLDVSGLTDVLGNPVNVNDVTVSDDGNGNAVLTFPNGESLTLIGVAPSQVNDPAVLVAMGIPAETLNFIVEGTSGDDLIDASYTGDPQGDLVDANDNLGGNNDDMVQAGDGADTVFAGDGNDTILGEGGDDLIHGDGGNDQVLAGDGNDYVEAGLGDDEVYGDAGRDTVYGGLGNDTIDGGDGNDWLDGGAGDDSLSGGAGNDTLTTGDGNDTLQGGDDADLFNVAVNAGDTTVIGGEGGTDNDTLNLATSTNAVEVTFSGNEAGTATHGPMTVEEVTFSEIENFVLTSQDDTFNASATTNGTYVQSGDGADTLIGGSGNDSLMGEAGNDSIESWGGDDLVDAGSGNDYVFSGTGNDTVYGGEGDDQIAAWTGNNAVGGGDGNDTISAEDGNDTLNGDAGNDLIFGGSGNDSITGGDGNDTINAGDGVDIVHGGADADTFVVQNPMGSNTIYGGETGDDNDTIDLLNHAGEGVTVTFTGDEAGVITGATAGTTTFAGIEGLVLTMEDDLADASGNGAGISIDGAYGDDTLIGGTGADSLQGGFGDDTIVLEDGFGDDSIDGAEGDETTGDVLDASAVTGDLVLDLSSGDAADPEDGVLTLGGDTASFDNIESFVLGSGNDYVIGSTGDDVVQTGTGEDTVDGGLGNDRFGLGDDGVSDVVVLKNGDGNDTLTGFDAPIDNGDGTFTGVDRLVVSDLTDAGGNPVNTDDVTVTDTNGDGTGDAILTFPDGTSVTLVGVPVSEVSSPDQLAAMGIPYAPNLIVDGTAGDDWMDPGFTDIHGDQVDGSDGDEDTIYGYEGNDVVLGGAGNDLVYGGADNDALHGEDGNDSLWGDAGDDSLYGGIGDDVLDGGAGNDALTAGEGNDALVGAAGEDGLWGGDGADTLSGGADNDVLSGDEGDDLLDGGTGDDLLGGDTGNDTMFGDDGVDTLYGGEGDDSMAGGTGDDWLHGETGDDSLNGDAGNDILFGNEGNDSINGGDGNDVVDAGIGNDIVDGGLGDDSLFGDAGNDTLTGGDGADSMEGGDDRDTFFGGIGDVVDGGEGGDDYDVLDLTAWGHPATNIVYDVNNPENGTVEFLDGNGDVIGTMSFTNIEAVMACFTPGAMILTDQGEVAVEHLQPGDRVLTRDNGFQTIRWAGRRDLSLAELIVEPRFNPVFIAQGALGNGLPERDVLVSPQHRMLITGARAELLFGEYEVLAAAKHLVGLPGIEQRLTRGVSYIHILFDQHEIVRADGAWSESFQPGQQTLEGLDQGQRDEILALFPELAEDLGTFPAARMTLKAREARVLMQA